jgi:nucleoporin SEH1
VLATCSFDRQAAVWEESFGDVGREGVKSNWIKKSILVDSRTAVTDVKFAPKHLGLQLVSKLQGNKEDFFYLHQQQ